MNLCHVTRLSVRMAEFFLQIIFVTQIKTVVLQN